MTCRLRDRFARKRKRRGPLNLLILVGLIFALAISSFVGLSNLAVDDGEPGGDIFTGHLVDSQFVGSTEGTVREDRDCQTTDGTMYTCTAVIYHPGGTIYFHYTHNMHAQPCLARDNRVLVSAPLDGTATVKRLS